MQIGGWTLHACLLLTFPTRSRQKQMAEREVRRDAECHLSVGGPCLVASSWTGRDRTARLSMCPGAEHTQACRPGFFIQLGQGWAKKVVFKKVGRHSERTQRDSHKLRDPKDGCQHQILEGAWGESPLSLRRSPPWGHLDSDFCCWSRETGCCFSPQLAVLCYGGPGELIQF